MPKLRLAFLSLMLLVGLGLTGGCKPNTDNAAPPVETPRSTGQKETTSPKSTDSEPSHEKQVGDETNIRAAVEKTLTEPGVSGGNSPFPAGTRVQKVTLEDAIVTLDFSPEFNQIKTMGETDESLAQKALCKSLSPFDNLDKMRVTVDGKPFDSEATDWNTPFRIRGDFPTADKDKGFEVKPNHSGSDTAPEGEK